MATGYAPDEQSFRRIANVVRTVESAFPSTDAEKRGTPNGRQLYLFRRLRGGGITDATITAIQPTEADGWDFSALPAVCSDGQPTDSSDLEQFTINQAALLEGCVFPEQLFHAVNIDHQWYAVGYANTSISGEYSDADDAILLNDCGGLVVPVAMLVSSADAAEIDGSAATAVWVRSSRTYVLAAFGCET